jgi:hypothetical protein
MGRKRGASCVLAAIAFFSLAMSAAAEPRERRRIEFGAGLDAGAFVYAQKVDGGYWVLGRPYDLAWYSVQVQGRLSAEFALPSVRGLGVGIGCLGLAALDAKGSGSDDLYSVHIDTRQYDFGGLGGVSASYRAAEGWKLDAILGYGGTGIDEYYGGLGPALSLAFLHSLSDGALAAEIGIRGTFMYLSYASEGTTSAERGPYFSLAFEAALDWAP